MNYNISNIKIDKYILNELDFEIYNYSYKLNLGDEKERTRIYNSFIYKYTNNFNYNFDNDDADYIINLNKKYYYNNSQRYNQSEIEYTFIKNKLTTFNVEYNPYKFEFFVKNENKTFLKIGEYLIGSGEMLMKVIDDYTLKFFIFLRLLNTSIIDLFNLSSHIKLTLNNGELVNINNKPRLLGIAQIIYNHPVADILNNYNVDNIKYFKHRFNYIKNNINDLYVQDDQTYSSILLNFDVDTYINFEYFKSIVSEEQYMFINIGVYVFDNNKNYITFIDDKQLTNGEYYMLTKNNYYIFEGIFNIPIPDTPLRPFFGAFIDINLKNNSPIKSSNYLSNKIINNKVKTYSYWTDQPEILCNIDYYKPNLRINGYTTTIDYNPNQLYLNMPTNILFPCEIRFYLDAQPTNNYVIRLLTKNDNGTYKILLDDKLLSGTTFNYLWADENGYHAIEPKNSYEKYNGAKFFQVINLFTNQTHIRGKVFFSYSNFKYIRSLHKFEDILNGYNNDNYNNRKYNETTDNYDLNVLNYYTTDKILNEELAYIYFKKIQNINMFVSEFTIYIFNSLNNFIEKHYFILEDNKQIEFIFIKNKKYIFEFKIIYNNNYNMGNNDRIVIGSLLNVNIEQNLYVSSTSVNKNKILDTISPFSLNNNINYVDSPDDKRTYYFIDNDRTKIYSSSIIYNKNELLKLDSNIFDYKFNKFYFKKTSIDINENNIFKININSSSVLNNYYTNSGLIFTLKYNVVNDINYSFDNSIVLYSNEGALLSEFINISYNNNRGAFLKCYNIKNPSLTKNFYFKLINNVLIINDEPELFDCLKNLDYCFKIFFASSSNNNYILDFITYDNNDPFDIIRHTSNKNIYDNLLSTSIIDTENNLPININSFFNNSIVVGKRNEISVLSPENLLDYGEYKITINKTENQSNIFKINYFDRIPEKNLTNKIKQITEIITLNDISQDLIITNKFNNDTKSYYNFYNFTSIIDGISYIGDFVNKYNNIDLKTDNCSCSNYYKNNYNYNIRIIINVDLLLSNLTFKDYYGDNTLLNIYMYDENDVFIDELSVKKDNIIMFVIADTSFSAFIFELNKNYKFYFNILSVDNHIIIKDIIKKSILIQVPSDTYYVNIDYNININKFITYFNNVVNNKFINDFEVESLNNNKLLFKLKNNNQFKTIDIEMSDSLYEYLGFTNSNIILSDDYNVGNKTFYSTNYFNNAKAESSNYFYYIFIGIGIIVAIIIIIILIIIYNKQTNNVNSNIIYNDLF